MYLSLHIYNTPRLIEHTSNCYVIHGIRMQAAVSHNSVSRNLLLQMCFWHIHVHCITYNSEINNSYSYSYSKYFVYI